MLSTEELKKHRKAGKIANEITTTFRKKIKPESTLLGIAEEAEGMIRELGAKPAFPMNLSLNDIAAHYTPVASDKTVVGENILKFDLGVHIDGYIADTAFTLDFSGEHGDLIKASDTALKEAIKLCTPGRNVREIGEAVQSAIEKFGFNPIGNLSGHLLGKFRIHAGVTIPNIPAGDDVLEEGTAVAVEPFSTNGAGHVTEAPDSVIFSFIERKPVRMREAKRILEDADRKYSGLPFASRWLKYPPITLKIALNQLLQAKALYSYPILIEKKNGIISQSEHTIIVKDKPEVIT